MIKAFGFYISIVALMLTACATGKKKQPELFDFDTQAHRGGRGLMPENTIEAMYHAIDLGVKTLEMDLQVSKDKIVLVSHDSYMGYKFCLTPECKEMTDKDGRSRFLLNMPYDSIRKYDVGLKTHPDFLKQKKMKAYKPKLSDLLDAVEVYARKKNREIHYNIEIKTSPEYKDIGHPPVQEFVDLAMAVILKKKIEKRTTIQSFDRRSLGIVNKQYPMVKTSFLVFKSNKKSLEEQISYLGFKPTVFSPEYGLVTPQLVQQCHDKNIKIIPWTVNDATEIQRLKLMKVDGIISDYPELFKL